MAKLWFSSRVVAIKSLNAMIVKDHEGKILGSVLYVLVYAHECALLVNFSIDDAKKNLGGRIKYPEKYWNHIFVSHKCGKRMCYARYRIQARGLEFEVGNKFLLRQLTGLLIRQKCQTCSPKSPWKINNMNCLIKYREKEEVEDWSSRRYEDLRFNPNL
jgi:hypothetical protein